MNPSNIKLGNITPSMVGREIGPYRILQKVAQGGMCSVYKGLHTGLEQEVAIKVLSAEAFEDPCIRDRFINEAKIQAQLSHPGVIKTLNYLEQDGTVYLVLEYVNGESLDVLLKRAGALPMDRAAAIFMSVLDAIDFMHSKGIIHRDIKPANIMLSYDGFVKVMDFGIAKVMGEKGKTRAGIRIGTLWYMSPEQIRGEEATVLTDIYSLGVTFYQMVTGRVPFTGELEFDIMRGHLEEEPQRPWKINKDIPKEMGEIILKALAKNPKERYQSVREFLEALRTATKTNGETKIISQMPEKRVALMKGLSSFRRLSPAKRRVLVAMLILGVMALAVFAVYLVHGKGGKSIPFFGGTEGTLKNEKSSEGPGEAGLTGKPPEEKGAAATGQHEKKTAGAEKRSSGQSGGDDIKKIPSKKEKKPEAEEKTEWRIRK